MTKHGEGMITSQDTQKDTLQKRTGDEDLWMAMDQGIIIIIYHNIRAY